MIWKLIRATVKPGCRDEFVRRQRIWNDAMSRQQGFRSVQIAVDPADPLSVTILIAMESREALDRFMKGDHDPLFSATRMRELYDKLDIHVLDVIEPGPQAVRLEVTPSRSGPAHQVVLLGQLYRVSALLRVAVSSGLFDAIGQGAERAALHARWPGAARGVDRLLEGLSALGLVRIEGDAVTLAPLAERHLVRGAATYAGDAVLFDTRPAIWRRWGALDETLGLGPVEAPASDHALFVRAMSSIAGAFQAEALARTVDLTGRRRLLDVGGACGDYALRLCEQTPDLEAVVFDLPETEPHARARFQGAAAGRLTFAGGDYRRALPGGFDAVLLSNVLRGEAPAEARALLVRVLDSLVPGGMVIVHDLFPADPLGRGSLAAALFGLHLPGAENPSVAQAVAMLADAGFRDAEVRPIDGYVVADHVIQARRP